MNNRLELPLGDSKLYWDKVCNDIETKLLKKVRNPRLSTSIPYPVITPTSIHDSIMSSASVCDFNNSDFSAQYSESEIVRTSDPESAIEVSTLLLHSDKSKMINKTSNDTIELADQCKKYRRPNGPENINTLTKLSKMMKLVNNFLSNNRVQVQSPKKYPTLTKVTGEIDKIEFLETKPNNHLVEYESRSIEKKSLKKSKEEDETSRDATLNKKSVGFRENFKKTTEWIGTENNEIATVTKPRRVRGPSLSIASAVPSFGKVVISIEDIDSLENHEEPDASKERPSPDILHPTKDAPMKTGLKERKTEEDKSPGNFLRVPRMIPSGIFSYPAFYQKCDQQDDFKEEQITEKAYETKILKESQALRRKRALWPKRALINVFRAVKTMRASLNFKARMESETNRFFALPLETYSSSQRFSISSEDQTDQTDDFDFSTYLEKNHENDLRGKIDESGSSSSSYVNDRQKLMRKATIHLLSKDLEKRTIGMCTKQKDSTSSYSNRTIGENRSAGIKRHHQKISGRRLIGVRELAQIYPRVKADKCLACMCRSLGDIDQTRLRKTQGTLSPNEITNDIYSSDDETLSQSLDPNSSTCRDKYFSDKRKLDETLASFARDDNNKLESTSDFLEVSRDVSKSTVRETSILSTTNKREADDSSKSQVISKLPMKTLITASSLITLASEQSRSISDQDDSDQGGSQNADNGVDQGRGTTLKVLAPCHMPINLKPSLEPLKLLKSKKSCSIKCRIASAEKSADSLANDDENDSDGDIDSGKQIANDATTEFDVESCLAKIDNLISPRIQRTTMEKKTDKQNKSVIGSEQSISIQYNFGTRPVDDTSIMSDSEVIEIANKCLENNLSRGEIFQILANEYRNRVCLESLQKNYLPNSQRTKMNEKIAMNLLALLAESKSFLNRGKTPNDSFNPSFSSKQPSLSDSHQLRRILPLKSYNLVAPILGLAKWYPSKRRSTLRDVAKRASRMEKKEKTIDSTFDLIVHPPSRLEQNVSFEKNWKIDRSRLNPYSLFLRKPRRKAITWRPLTEYDLEGYDPEATLKKRATVITDKICVDFCQWLESLTAGTNRTNEINVEVLKDMFETDFTADVCSTMQMEIKEMPMVPTAVAIARNVPEAGELALTRRHLVKDARAERKPKQTVGFGTCLPNYLKFIPPNNQVEKKWLQCESVPKELESMEAVWKGITQLASVQSFISWLIAHPEVKRPKNLENMLARRKSHAPRKSIIEDLEHLELERDQIKSLRVVDNNLDA